MHTVNFNVGGMCLCVQICIVVYVFWGWDMMDDGLMYFWCILYGFMDFDWCMHGWWISICIALILFVWMGGASLHSKSPFGRRQFEFSSKIFNLIYANRRLTFRPGLGKEGRHECFTSFCEADRCQDWIQGSRLSNFIQASYIINSFV